MLDELPLADGGDCVDAEPPVELDGVGAGSGLEVWPPDAVVPAPGELGDAVDADPLDDEVGALEAVPDPEPCVELAVEDE